MERGVHGGGRLTGTPIRATRHSVRLVKSANSTTPGGLRDQSPETAWHQDLGQVQPGQHHIRQAAQKLRTGEAWQDHNLLFCTSVGTPLDASYVRRAFRRITKRAGLGTTWSPRELRHSFVSIMSDQGVPIETIAALVGHAGDHQGCPGDERNLRRAAHRLRVRVRWLPQLAPTDFRT
ncbi:MAG: tyrosine-type recombinase/integrase [Nonomuraea sp.]|nr:tyrosine-type recombinase/integrase [Nonomuraea sp.]